MTAPSILAARADATAARADLAATLDELKSRLQPRTLAQNTLETVRERSEDLAERGADFARRKPAAAVGLAALAGLIVARKPALRAVKRLFSRHGATDGDDAPLSLTEPRHAANAVPKELLP